VIALWGRHSRSVPQGKAITCFYFCKRSFKEVVMPKDWKKYLMIADLKALNQHILSWTRNRIKTFFNHRNTSFPDL
jgi:hypothetical protein